LGFGFWVASGAVAFLDTHRPLVSDALSQRELVFGVRQLGFCHLDRGSARGKFGALRTIIYREERVPSLHSAPDLDIDPRDDARELGPYGNVLRTGFDDPRTSNKRVIRRLRRIGNCRGWHRGFAAAHHCENGDA
jgi:hypothetical protein